MPTRTPTTYPTSGGLRDRQFRPLDLEIQAACAFALALALGGAALLAASTVLGGAALLLIGALIGRRSLSVLATDPNSGRTVRPREQAGFDATLAVALGAIAIVLAATGDTGAAISAGIGGAVLGALSLRTRYLAG